MQIATMIAGVLAEAVGWVFVSYRKVSVWRVVPALTGAIGLVGVIARRPVWAGHPGAFPALAVGLGTGGLLYVATLAFVALATLYEPFREAVVDQYEPAETVSGATALVLTVVLTVPAEELFWRGLFQGRLSLTFSAAGAAGITCLAYFACRLPSRSMPLLAAALVGGGLWAALAWWSAGMLASLGSHILWTGLMLVRPPGASRSARESP